MSITVTSTPNTKTQAPSAPVESAKVDEKAASAQEADETLEVSEASAEVKAESEGSEQGEQKEPPKRVQKKIDKLIKQRAQAREEAEFWRKEALKPREAKPPQGERVEKMPTANGAPQADQFESHEEYVRAVARYEAKEEFKAEAVKAKEREATSEVEKKLKDYNKRVTEFAKEHEDFHDIMDDVADTPVSATVHDAILEVGPALAYELAKNPDELKRICALPERSAARALGRIEARLESPTETKELPKVSKAPPPLKTVGGKVSEGTRKSIFDPSLSQSEYEAMRREQIAKRNAAWG